MDSENCCKKNIFQSFLDSVGKISKDPSFASKNIVEERLKICRSCDRFNESISMCRECGCNMILKTRFSVVNCPINKW